ncbi:MAG: hypothetical protein CMP39_00175 [Rickettsiales bacterium]|nr:hypothetical protein [Rickettsiales bacterium]|tara:strand:- start:684 stop:1166 length:483 start_codon:yes stop_codon:yes gene_type:complete
MKLKNIWGDIFKTKKEISNESLLEKVILFNDLNVFEIQRLLPFLHVRQFQKNEIIFQKDEPGESLYIIKSGSVAIYESLSDEKITLKPTSFFGELSLVDENPRVVSATATKNAELLVLFRSDLLKIKQEHPKMAVKIIYNLSYILGKRLSTIYSDHNTKK